MPSDQPFALTVAWPGIPIEIVPAQAHWQTDPAVRTGTPPMTTFAEPGVQGPVGTGTQGIGVRTPIAAEVAAATAGFAGELHIPNVGMFAIGIVSAMVATSCPPAVTGGPFGTAVSGTGGPRPIVQDSIAVLTTSGGIVGTSPAPATWRDGPVRPLPIGVSHGGADNAWTSAGQAAQVFGPQAAIGA